MGNFPPHIAFLQKYSILWIEVSVRNFADAFHTKENGNVERHCTTGSQFFLVEDWVHGLSHYHSASDGR